MFCWTGSNIWADLDLAMDPYNKHFLDFNGARHFFSKCFRYVNVFHVNYGQKFQIKAQLMTDPLYNKQDLMRLHYGFSVKLNVFMALTKCFRENFREFFWFAFNSYNFCSPMALRPQSKIQ